MSTSRKLLIGSLVSSLGVIGCVSDQLGNELVGGGAGDGTATAIKGWPAGMPRSPQPTGNTEPVVDDPGASTYCGAGDNPIADVEVYDLEALDRELGGDDELQRYSGLTNIDSCEAAREMMDARSELEESEVDDASQGLPELSSGAVEKWLGGSERSLSASIGITIFGATRANDAFCSGTLVGQSSLITSAHCFGKTLGTSSGQVWIAVSYRSPRDDKYYWVSDSKVTTTNSMSVLKQAFVDIHPDYTGSGDSDDDIAIVTLPYIGPNTRIPQSWSVPNGTSDFMPLVLADVSKNQSTSFHGWGITADNATNSGRARVPKDNTAKGVDWVSSTKKQFRVDAETNFRICAGDSGGPAYTANGNRRLTGLPSRVLTRSPAPTNWCAQSGDSQFWTAIPPKLTWIESRIGAFRPGACRRDSNAGQMRCF